MRLADMLATRHGDSHDATRETKFEVVQRHYTHMYRAKFLLCYTKFIPV